jgi:hypothetical protein
LDHSNLLHRISRKRSRFASPPSASIPDAGGIGPDRAWYTYPMTELLKEAVAMLKELPEDVQDAVAKYLLLYAHELQHQFAE